MACRVYSDVLYVTLLSRRSLPVVAKSPPMTTTSISSSSRLDFRVSYASLMRAKYAFAASRSRGVASGPTATSGWHLLARCRYARWTSAKSPGGGGTTCDRGPGPRADHLSSRPSTTSTRAFAAAAFAAAAERGKMLGPTVPSGGGDLSAARRRLRRRTLGMRG